MDLCLITWSAPNGHWLCHQQSPEVLQIKTYGWNVSLNTMTVIVWPQCLNFDWKLKCNFFRKATVVNYGEITAVLAAPIYAGYLEGVAIEAAVWRVSDPSFSLQACDQPHGGGRISNLEKLAKISSPMPPPAASCPATPLRGPRTPRGPAPVMPVRQQGGENQVRVEKIKSPRRFQDDPWLNINCKTLIW